MLGHLVRDRGSPPEAGTGRHVECLRDVNEVHVGALLLGKFQPEPHRLLRRGRAIRGDHDLLHRFHVFASFRGRSSS
jgi:hypothetical protein